MAEFDIDIELNLSEQVRHLVNDSRAVNEHDIFCAVKGSVTEGKGYIESAINNGCDLVIFECDSREEHGNVSTIRSAGQDVKQIAFYQLNQSLFSIL